MAKLTCCRRLSHDIFVGHWPNKEKKYASDACQRAIRAEEGI